MFNGTYWIDPQGKMVPVNVEPFGLTSHEEFAETNFNLSLEKAFQLGYIRVQAFENNYLFIDFKNKRVKQKQVKSLQKLFELHYKTITIEKNRVCKDFLAEEKELAYNFLLN